MFSRYVMFLNRNCDIFALLLLREKEIKAAEWLTFGVKTKQFFCRLSNGTEALALLTQTLGCYMKSQWTQFNSCQQSGSTATMDFFYALASDSQRAFVCVLETQFLPNPFLFSTHRLCP